MGNKTRHNSGIPVFLLLAFCACALIATTLLLYKVNRDMEDTFGRPGTNIGMIQQQRLVFALWTQRDELTSPVQGISSGKVIFEIMAADTVQSIAQKLVGAGLISDSRAFVNLLVYKGFDTAIQTGLFEFEPEITAIDIAHRIYTTPGDLVEFVILPGWRAEEISETLSYYAFTFTPAEFLAAVKKPGSVDGLIEPYGSFGTLDGLLYPGTYQVSRSNSLSEFINTFLEEFDKKVNKTIKDNFAQRGLSLQEAVILASIVEKETLEASEAPVIASVFYNRLAAGMRLESDPTVQYSLGFDDSQKTWWKSHLSLEDLKKDSVYNTYQVNGLPPSPICNPGKNAFKAVASPAETDYYYFRASCDASGKHNFSENFDQHLQFSCD